MGFVHLESAINRASDMLWLLSVVSQIQSWHALFALSESLNVDKTAFKVQGGIDIVNHTRSLKLRSLSRYRTPNFLQCQIQYLWHDLTHVANNFTENHRVIHVDSWRVLSHIRDMLQIHSYDFGYSFMPRGIYLNSWSQETESAFDRCSLVHIYIYSSHVADIGS